MFTFENFMVQIQVKVKNVQLAFQSKNGKPMLYEKETVI